MHGRASNCVRVHLPDIHPTPIEFPVSQLGAVSADHYGHPDFIADRQAEPLSADTELALGHLLAHVPGNNPAVRPAVLAFLHLYLSMFSPAIWLPPLDVCVRSELPVGAGLGSSASFSVVVAAGLLKLAVWDSSELSAQLPASLVNAWAFMAEKVIHGNPSGVDNSLATFGNDLVTISTEFNSLRFLLTDTCVPKNTKRQVEMVRTRKTRFPSVMDLLIDSVEQIVQECKAVFRDVEQGTISETEMRSSMEALIEMNHGVMAACGVSHPSLETVRLVTAAHGLQSKLTGAGGGGCALTFVPTGTPRETIRAIQTQLHAKGFKCYETELGGAGYQVRTRAGDEAVNDDALFSDFVAGGGVDELRALFSDKRMDPR
ncbi:hypothetical protein HDU86_001001 [Geranomyces michiganensis]|nr:hypothetical protein HDU86_001001 [Geranomyces michiganensis]